MNESWNSSPRKNNNWKSPCERLGIQENLWYDKHKMSAEVITISNVTKTLKELADSAFKAK